MQVKWDKISCSLSQSGSLSALASPAKQTQHSLHYPQIKTLPISEYKGIKKGKFYHFPSEITQRQISSYSVLFLTKGQGKHSKDFLRKVLSKYSIVQK